MGVSRWVAVVCVAGVAMSVTPGPDRPDITMLYKDNTNTCVAGANTNGYGLAFMSERLTDDVHINEFEYRNGNGSTIDSSSDCDFEQRPGDSCWQNWGSNHLTLAKSGYHAIYPVTDERWNSFAIYRSDYSGIPKYNKKYNIEQQYFIGISVRSTANAQILLCSTDSPRYRPCYWIIIDGLTRTFDLTAIRKCTNGVPDKWATDDDPECKMFRHNVTTPRKLLDESKWTHFMLSREGGDRLRLWLWDVDTGATPLLDYTDDTPLTLKYMYVRSYNSIADWKVHTYQYAVVRYKKGLLKLGPALNFASASPVCISLYVTMCPKCKMNIRLEDENGKIEMEKIEENFNAPIMTWKNVRLQGEISTSSNKQYHLWASLRTTDGTDDNTFWAIDDFRKCSNNEFRVISTISSKNVLCQSLNYPGWKFNPNMQAETNEPPRCSDVRYIGQHCNISCNLVNLKDGCYGHKVCLSVQEGIRQGACTCAAGYIWDAYNRCTQTCKAGSYGYNCLNTCGKCKNNNACYRSSGGCPQGCEDGYLRPYCQTTYSRLAAAPVVVKEFFTKVTLKFNNLTISGAEGVTESIQLECKKTNTGQANIWANCSEQMHPIPNRGEEVTITGLEKETSYLIRAIVYTKAGDAYRNDDVPTVEATTTCKVDVDISIIETSRNATISFKTSSDSCTLERYVIKLQQNGTQIRAPQYVWQNMFFGDLTPFIDYQIVLTHERITSYRKEKNFKTKQEAPGEIINFNILETSDNAVVLSWKEPNEKNGIIEKYILTYELIQRIGCNNNKQISSPRNMTVLPSHISHVTVSSLQPYSTYYITVAAETILPGKPIGLLCNTTMINDISKEELPEYISTTNNLTAGSVTVHWTVDCWKQRGPLYFKIVFACVQNEWCCQTPDGLLDNENSLNGGATAYGLTPFTNYSVELRAKRSQSGDLTTFSRTTELYTPVGSPPVVRNVTSYSKSRISISLRWLDPYPPHGYLEKYSIRYCYRNDSSSCKIIEITADQLVACDLWNDHFNCYILTNLYTHYEYTINIKAKNKDVRVWSPDTSLTVLTAEDKPSAPLNLTRQWKNNELILSWSHPYITNGRLKKFIITVTQSKTELENQDEKPFYNYVHSIRAEMKNYNYRIKQMFRYSSSYIVTVFGANSYNGDNATLHIDTPPETPELAGDVAVDEETTTATTVTVVIPGVTKKTSFLYVMVSKINSKPKTNIVENSDEILKYSNYEDTWIAKEIVDLNDHWIKVFLGSGETVQSQHLNKKFVNYKLEPSTNYELTLVLINKYKNESSFKVYYQQIRTASKSNSGLYALTFLILLPVAIYGIYRYIRNKRIEASYITPEMPVRTSYLEVLPLDDIGSTNDNRQVPIEENEYAVPELIPNSSSYMYNEPEEERTYDRVKNTNISPTYQNLLSRKLNKNNEHTYANT